MAVLRYPEERSGCQIAGARLAVAETNGKTFVGFALAGSAVRMVRRVMLIRCTSCSWHAAATASFGGRIGSAPAAAKFSAAIKAARGLVIS